MRVVVVNGNVNVVKVLIYYGVNVYIMDKEGKSMFMNVVFNGFEVLVKFFVKKGVFVKMKLEYGKMVLDFVKFFECECVIYFF